MKRRTKGGAMPKLQRSEVADIERTAGMPIIPLPTPYGWEAVVKVGRTSTRLFAAQTKDSFDELMRQAEDTRESVTK